MSERSRFAHGRLHGGCCPLSFVLCPLSFVLCPLSFVRGPWSVDVGCWDCSLIGQLYSPWSISREVGGGRAGVYFETPIGVSR